MLFVSNDG